MEKLGQDEPRLGEGERREAGGRTSSAACKQQMGHAARWSVSR